MYDEIIKEVNSNVSADMIIKRLAETVPQLSSSEYLDNSYNIFHLKRMIKNLIRKESQFGLTCDTQIKKYEEDLLKLRAIRNQSRKFWRAVNPKVHRNFSTIPFVIVESKGLIKD